MISLLALVLSYTAAPVLSSFMADYLVEQQIEQAKQQDMADEGKVAKPYEEAEQKAVSYTHLDVYKRQPHAINIVHNSGIRKN